MTILFIHFIYDLNNYYSHSNQISNFVYIFRCYRKIPHIKYHNLINTPSSLINQNSKLNNKFLVVF